MGEVRPGGRRLPDRGGMGGEVRQTVATRGHLKQTDYGKRWLSVVVCMWLFFSADNLPLAHRGVSKCIGFAAFLVKTPTTTTTTTTAAAAATTNNNNN